MIYGDNAKQTNPCTVRYSKGAQGVRKTAFKQTTGRQDNHDTVRRGEQRAGKFQMRTPVPVAELTPLASPQYILAFFLLLRRFPEIEPDHPQKSPE